MRDLDDEKTFENIREIAVEIFQREGRDFDTEYAEWAAAGKPIMGRKESETIA